MNQKDYYQILEVSKDATAGQIKDAYRKLAFKYHPDRTRDAGHADRMKLINEAYAVLSNPAKRREYDALQTQFGTGAYNHFRQTYSDRDIFKGSDVQQLFEEMARSFGLRGFDQIFKELYGEGMRSFQYRRPGFFAGGFIFMGRPGKGPGPAMLPRGLGPLVSFLFNKIIGLPAMHRGRDASDTIVIGPQMARQGGPYAYFYHRQAKKLVVKIPPGVRDGQQLRLAGLGESGPRDDQPGDLYLTVRIKTPLIQKIKTTLAGLLPK